MEIEKIDKYEVNLDDWVKVTTSGNVVELMAMEHKSNGSPIRKISADKYVNIDTGEIGEYRHTEHRGQGKNELRRTFKRIRDIINCNTDNPDNCKWVTLTYKENMTDVSRLYKDTEKYIKRLRYKYGKFEYVQVVEPQERGAWHIHMIMIFKDKAPYIDNKEMAKIWGYGYTDTQKLENNDNIGAYLSAYLGDVELTNENLKNVLENDTEKIVVKDVEFKDGSKKSYIKGGRLHMYPVGMNIYRTSRGVKRPVVTRMKENDALKKVNSAKLTYEKTIRLSDDNTGFENTINYRYYNLKRK